MLGLGWTEILVIAVVALIVVGPKDLPVMLRNAGRAFGTVRRMSNEFRREIDKIASAEEMKEISRSISDPIAQTRTEISREFNQMKNGKISPSGAIKPKEGQDTVFETLTERAGKPSARIAAPKQDVGAIEDQSAPGTVTPTTELDAGTGPAIAAKPEKVKASRGRGNRAALDGTVPVKAVPAKAVPAKAAQAKAVPAQSAIAKPKPSRATSSKAAAGGTAPAKKAGGGKLKAVKAGAAKSAPAADTQTPAASAGAGEKKRATKSKAGPAARNADAKTPAKRQPAATARSAKDASATSTPARNLAAVAGESGRADESLDATRRAQDRKLANADSGENS